MKRTLVIGDIHGGLKALTQVMERAGINQDDSLIFLGDYVDGWTESAKVIEFLTELDQKFSCTFIKGNHDAWCEIWLESERIDRSWFEHGGKGTIASYRNDENVVPEDLRQNHIAFFGKMKHYFVDEKNRLFIHAGFSSMHGPEKEVYESNYSWDRTLWETALAVGKNADPHSEFYPKRLKLFSEIFIGHTPTTDYGVNTPIHAANLWNVDTGAGKTGKLTVMDIDTKQFWQSDVVRELYPDEKGRNKTSYNEDSH